MTGHDESESVAKYILQIQKNNGKDGAAWTITIDEAVEMIRKANEHQTFLENAYKNRGIPIHLFATPGKNALGGIIYSILGSGMPYLGHFGVSKDTEVDFERPLVLDYTACLILYRLGLLEMVSSWVSNVWIDQHLLEIWFSDIDRLKSVQISVAQKAIRLSDTIKNLQYLSRPSEEHILRVGFDHVLLRCAEDTDAILVAEHSHCEFFNKAVPDGWNKSRIHPHALYAALDRMKLPHPRYDYTASLEESIAKVTPQCRLVLDRAVIDELESTGILEDIFNLFHVVLPMELVSRIHNEANGYRSRGKAAKWLEEAYNVVGKLLLQGRISRKPSKMPQEPDTNVYCQLFTDEFSLISNIKSTLVIDDCFGTSYRQIDVRRGNSPIISSYDLITSAYQNGKLDDNKYYQLMRSTRRLRFSAVNSRIPAYSAIMSAHCTAFCRVSLTSCMARSSASICSKSWACSTWYLSTSRVKLSLEMRPDRESSYSRSNILVTSSYRFRACFSLPSLFFALPPSALSFILIAKATALSLSS